MADRPFWGDETVMQNQSLSPDILAYGDSWFWYPNNNLMTPINNLWNGTKTVLVKGDNGVELREMIGGIPRLWNDFRNAMVGYKNTISAVMVSAGGNDFAGIEHFQTLLKVDCSNAATSDDCFDLGNQAAGIEQQPWRMLREIAHNYQFLIDFVRSVRPDVPIFLHNYC